MDLAKCGGTRRLEIWHPYAVLHYLKKPVDLLTPYLSAAVSARRVAASFV